MRWCAGVPSGSFSTAPTIVGDPTGAHHALHGGDRLGVGGGIRVERALPPHDQVGRIADQAFVLLDVELGDPNILLARRGSARLAHVHLDHRHVERFAVGRGERDQHRAGHHRDDRDEADEPSSPIAGPARQLRDQRVDQHDDEGDAPHPGHRGEPYREAVVHLAKPRGSPS